MADYLTRAMELHPDARTALVASETYLTAECTWRVYADLRTRRLVTPDGQITPKGHRFVDALEGRNA